VRRVPVRGIPRVGIRTQRPGLPAGLLPTRKALTDGGFQSKGDGPRIPTMPYELQRQDQSLASKGVVPRLYALDLREHYLPSGRRRAPS
jgi:hypothetical protein